MQQAPTHEADKLNAQTLLCEVLLGDARQCGEVNPSFMSEGAHGVKGILTSFTFMCYLSLGGLPQQFPAYLLGSLQPHGSKRMRSKDDCMA